MVLVKCKEFRIRDYLDLLETEGRELHMSPMVALSEVRPWMARKMTYVSAEQNGAFHERPHGKVGTLLLGRQVTISNFHHIHIVMCKKVNRGQVFNIYAHDRFDVLPGWASIGVRSSYGGPRFRKNIGCAP
jgi:hypothetical protein